MINILTIIGARPQFVKAAVFSRFIRRGKYKECINEIIIHTGQHFDENMSKIFFNELDIPRPNINLGIGGSYHGAMTGAMLEKIELVILDKKPDLLMVYGDTNSTLAGALAASKLNIPVVHIEAGLRSFDRTMPEEQNRIVTDHLSTYLFCPTETAMENLSREGVISDSNTGYQIYNVGDIMYDASLYYRKVAFNRPEEKRLIKSRIIPERYTLLTIHRAENTDNPNKLKAMLETLQIVSDLPIVFPVHPRTRKAIYSNGITLGCKIIAIDPVGYLDMIDLETNCDFIITDSGGVQKEACFFKKPCITLRETTEWIETVKTGWNVLVGSNPELISKAVKNRKVPLKDPDFYGDGNAKIKITDILLAINKKRV